jgi:hypothetical protein
VPLTVINGSVILCFYEGERAYSCDCFLLGSLTFNGLEGRFVLAEITADFNANSEVIMSVAVQGQTASLQVISAATAQIVEQHIEQAN